MSIKVNNDTANGSVEIKSPNVAGDYVVTTPARTCTMAGEDIVIGVGQTWQDVGGSRAVGVTFTNTTGKPIMVLIRRNEFVALTGYTFQLSINGVMLADIGSPGNTTSSRVTISAIIPHGSTYLMTVGNTGLGAWFELR